jgi:hypothetical protein
MGLLGELREIRLVLAREHDALDSGALGCERLLAYAADPEHLA